MRPASACGPGGASCRAGPPARPATAGVRSSVQQRLARPAVNGASPPAPRPASSPPRALPGFPRNPWHQHGSDASPPSPASSTPHTTATASVALSRLWGVAVRPATAAAAARASLLARSGLRPRGPLSALVVLAALAAALLSGLRAILRAASPRGCATCHGFGLQRCPMCGGAGALGGPSAGAFRGGAPCPRCLGKRGVPCEECGGGLAHAWVVGRRRPLFAHANSPRVGAEPGVGVAAARRRLVGVQASGQAAPAAAAPLARWREVLMRRTARRRPPSPPSPGEEELLGESQLRTLFD